MSNPTLEQRVAELERQVAELKQQRDNGQGAPKPHQPGRDDWKKTIGMFDGDPVFKEMIDYAARLREEERRRELQAMDEAENMRAES